MLVFPGIDMLQKQLFDQENIDGNKSTSSGFSQMHSVHFPLNFIIIIIIIIQLFVSSDR